MMLMNASFSYLEIFYLSFNDDYMFKTTDALRGFNNVQKISGMLNQLIDPRGEYLENYREADWCQKLSMSKRQYMSHNYLIHYYTTKLFKCISGVRKKVPKLSIDKKILLWGNRMMLSSVIYHGWEQPHCGHYISGVQKDDTPFWITDARIIKQQKLYCSS